ncbi:glutaminase A [Thermanaerovibrio acidaminovorans]|uniref:Glutaminase n=1 Tax=Thermanaerovibrio acidaminovorans (strain ATCC 49978 / DSM 6589 / Su883) TaxID=525903 RepID=D1B9S5_THEAS|nr:glutaminase A [Thermanaerovibrio acidaminovorans]ACZ19028.1 Glutaminase [Thermanaerovibrio acidaminovorans DSM 6589]
MINSVLETVIQQVRPLARQGRVATYIPELGKQDPDLLGIAMASVQGEVWTAGDWDRKFTMQSISKVVSLGLAMVEIGEERVFSRVGVDPTADPFNSIMRLEMVAPHRPQNPLINAGAIVTLSLLPHGEARERFEAVRDLARRLTGSQDLNLDEAVYLSEKETSDRNRSLAYFMRSVGVLEGDIEDILDSYFMQCSLSVNARDLAVMGATLASGGVNPFTGERVLPSKVCRVLRALMATCGLYDGSGEFAVRVGVPAKSGVGGGIVASVPMRYGIGVFGPALDPKGNSLGGIAMLEKLSQELSLRVL